VSGVTGFVTNTVTNNLINAKPNVLTFIGNASYKADLSNVVFNCAPITSDPQGNIYGPYFSIYSYGVASYSLDETYNLVNAKFITPFNTPLLQEWVPIVQVVWAPSTTSSLGGVFILGIPYYWNGYTDYSIYYKSLDSDQSEDPHLICDKVKLEFSSMAVDNVGNLLLLHTSRGGRPLLILTANRIAESIATGTPIEPEGFGIPNEVNTDVPVLSAIACDSNGYVYATVPTAGTVIRYDPYDKNSDPSPVLFASGFSQPSALAFDSVGNLYVGHGDQQKLAGISVISAGTTNTVTTVLNGFYVTAGSLAYSAPRDALVFSDGFNLSYIPLSGNTTAPVSLIQALSSHDYDTISNIITSVPGETYVLTTADIIAINSTLSSDAQTELPSNDPVVYICPNADQSVTVPVGEPDTSVILATSLPPDVSTTVTIGVDVVTVVYNSTSPPTLTVSGSGVLVSKTLNVGESFNTVSGTTITIYSIGLTVFGAVYGAVFVPGVGGVPPPICQPKTQGIDYSLFLSSQLSNADVQTYKEKGPVDMSEWIRRKRSLHSKKFGTC
jgi:hypothetical protein